ncbi:MAG TPA: SulP family inorganic anion transporter [Candidatus Blautia intestinipullorum]|nr:SulP family inorganic anion transporter [Candidatus Blautia intestinipullorum]
MKIKLFPTLRNYRKEFLAKDLVSGIIIAAVSIPIAMGYAQISGLPAVCGLYGSVFPIIFFALFSTSRQFIFGVDAAPAAIVGAALSSLGIASGSSAALQYVPVIALFAGLWLLLFYLLHADRIVNFISTPVMGGFISGIAVTIILMQLPKILGGTAGVGELPELLSHIAETAVHINIPSLILGAVSLAVLILAKRLIPRFPMAVAVMAAGVALTWVFHVQDYGVVLLDQVKPGMPGLFVPDFSQVNLTNAAGRALIISVVIMAETLLAENNFAEKNGYRLDDRQEILACAAGNIAAAAVGCCPVNGSISRTSMNEQYGGKTQAVSLAAGAVMAVILCFATGFIGFLPVPVLAAIVISALMNVVEVHLAVRLFRVSRREFMIFMAAGAAVLFLGTIYGVISGILLSFVAVILKATNPPRAFLGMIPGKMDFYDLERNRYACPVKHVMIYRFAENLFFANIKILQSDIEKNICEDTRAVILDAGAVSSLDITAADGLKRLASSLEKRNIHFYVTEHTAELNDQMRELGLGEMVRKGNVRRTILAALHDMGMKEPFDLDIPEEKAQALRMRQFSALSEEEENSLEEFSWAFGPAAVREIEGSVDYVLKQIHGISDIELLAKEGLEEKLKYWHSLGPLDEDELLRRLELHIQDLPEEVKEKSSLAIGLIENRRRMLRGKLLKEHPEILEHLKK